MNNDNITLLPPQDIKLNPSNPRVIKDGNFKKLVKSLKEFPEMASVREVVVNKDHMILGGNMRFKAMLEAGWTNIPVKIVDWDESKQREFVIKDNASFGEWDWDELANQYEADTLTDWGLDVPSTFYDKDLEDPEAPLLPPEPVSKKGEVYQLGRHRLMCGDSTHVEDVQILMGGQKADMLFCDPPYNVNYGSTMKDSLRHHVSVENAGKKILNDNFATNEEFFNFLRDFLVSVRPFVKGDVYVCMSSSELHTLQRAFMDAGGHWSTFIIWVKDHFTIGRSNYQRQYEPILYGWFEESSHFWSGSRKLSDVFKDDDFFTDPKGDVYVRLEAVTTDVWEFPRPKVSKEHPTMKPVALCARGITNSSPDGGLVMDVFGGSGSTLLACEQTNRTCYTMELDPKYCDVIRKRYWAFVNNGSYDGWEDNTRSVQG